MTKPGPPEKCQAGRRGTMTWDKDRCRELAMPNSIYCQRHALEAWARVETVRREKIKPWSGVVRGSQVGRRGSW